jgi:transposase
MDVASGVTISNCYRRHRHQEFLRFLNEIEDNLPAGLNVHLVMDNYGTHKVAKVPNWLARHPRYHVHFTPTSGSWLNLEERLSPATKTKPAAYTQAAYRKCRAKKCSPSKRLDQPQRSRSRAERSGATLIL